MRPDRTCRDRVRAAQQVSGPIGYAVYQPTSHVEVTEVHYPATGDVDDLLQSMLLRPSWASEQVREQLNLSSEELAAALLEFVDAGAVTGDGVQGRRFEVPPDAILARLIELEEEATSRRLDELRRFSATLSVLSSNLMLIQSRRWAGSQVDLLTGDPRVTAALDGAVTRTRYEILSMQAGPPQSAEALEKLLRQDRELLDRGVGLRLIHLCAMCQVPHGRAYLQALKDAGATIRIASVLPFRLVVVDKLLAYSFLSGRQEEPAALEIQGADLVHILTEVFEYCWVHGATVPCTEASAFGGDHSEQVLDQRERSLLRMFSQGLKDDAIARALGISSRTLRRLMTEVMRKLGATSRFQAGARAMAHGWLHD
ncbi:MAG: LuxR C-terminal-related transcriptional regulator [Pseudonocardiaceae bacterium]